MGLTLTVDGTASAVDPLFEVIVRRRLTVCSVLALLAILNRRQQRKQRFFSPSPLLSPVQNEGSQSACRIFLPHLSAFQPVGAPKLQAEKWGARHAHSRSNSKPMILVLFFVCEQLVMPRCLSP